MNFQDLGNEISALWDEPSYGKHGKGFKAARAVFKAIKDALQRGEKVSIQGFGTFSLKTRPPRKNFAYFSPHIQRPHKETGYITLPAKTYVHFQPTAALKRMLNPHLSTSSYS